MNFFLPSPARFACRLFRSDWFRVRFCNCFVAAQFDYSMKSSMFLTNIFLLLLLTFLILLFLKIWPPKIVNAFIRVCYYSIAYSSIWHTHTILVYLYAYTHVCVCLAIFLYDFSFVLAKATIVMMMMLMIMAMARGKRRPIKTQNWWWILLHTVNLQTKWLGVFFWLRNGCV